jgi:pimeloyl-ACP methyl ester carboxylesterase
MWLPLIPKLAQGRTVIALDVRGAGGSSKPASGYDKKTMAQDLHTLALTFPQDTYPNESWFVVAKLTARRDDMSASVTICRHRQPEQSG